MMNEQTEEQASLYAFDLLEPAESSAFEAQLASDSELRRHVDELRELAAKFAHGAPLRQPPTYLEEKILGAIGAEKKVTPIVRPSSGMVWFPWALAACLGVACVLLAADRAKAKKQVARLEKRNIFAQLQIATLNSQLKTAPTATATVLWDAEKQEGVLKVANVPATDPDRDYQLWIVDPEYKQPVDGGVFSVAQDGAKRIQFKPKERVTSANAFAVSLERKGGVPKAEGPMVLSGK